MKSVMLLLTGIGLILCMIAFIVLVVVSIVNDIEEHIAKMEKYDSIDALLGEGMFEMDARQEIDRLEKKLDAVLKDFYEYVQGGKEICAFCLHDDECEPGETICGATYKGFEWRGLKEDD